MALKELRLTLMHHKVFILYAADLVSQFDHFIPLF
jgi:hypothetical protein